MDQIGGIGARVDLEVRAGDTLGPFTATIEDNTGAAVNLTGFTFEGAVSRLNTDDGTVAMTCTIVDAVNGKIEFKIAAASTGAFADSASNFFKSSATYNYYVKGTDTAGTKKTYLYGLVRVAKEMPT